MRSAGSLTSPRSSSAVIVDQPAPSMSIAPAKCAIRWPLLAGHAGFAQRKATSPSGCSTGPSHAGQRSGIWNRRYRLPFVRLSCSTRTTSGMTSPARWMTTVSPARTSSRRTSSRLCRVARFTIVPPTSTGASAATGVSVPMRPTYTRMSSTVVVACSAGNLKATAQRGLRATYPSRS